MKRSVQWSREALDDIKERIHFISRDNPRAARRVADRIRDVGAALGEMAIGKPGCVTGTYEKPVARLPFVIACARSTRAGREQIVILRVIHAARDWPAEEWPE